MVTDRYPLQDDPLGFVLRLVLNSTSATRNYLHNIINDDTNYCQQDLELLKHNLMQSESSRRVTYRSIMNIDLNIHNIYNTKHNVYELYRTAFTRFRVSSHMLAIESGRWNRRGRGRLTVEERLWSCGLGLVQSEDHVISSCPLSNGLRNKYNFICINDLMSGDIPMETVCKFFYEVLEL